MWESIVTSIITAITWLLFGAFMLIWIGGLVWFFWRLWLVMWRDLKELAGVKERRGFAVEVKRDK